MSLRKLHPFRGPKYTTFRESFDLSGRVYLITGGGGFLGLRHAEAILEVGGIPVINDRTSRKVAEAVAALRKKFGRREILGAPADITKKAQVEAMVAKAARAFGRLDGLVNNAANNPKMTGKEDPALSRLENFPLARWEEDLAVGLTGAFLCAQACGKRMVKAGGGVVVNVSSDLGIIAPDQRVYLKPGQKEGEQVYKPITYSAVKGGLVMLTRYLATYWAKDKIRVNTLTPASVYAGQDQTLVGNIADRVPLGRMSHPDEFKGALIYLLSDASSYMTGHNLVVDGGRSIW